mgnify:FL=1
MNSNGKWWRDIRVDDNKTLDQVCIQIVDDNVNMTVPWFLMAAYAYYEMDEPILSDAQFDRLCKLMLKRWDDIEHHHKELISLDNLKAGSYIGHYPNRVQGAIKNLKEAYFGKSKRV